MERTANVFVPVVPETKEQFDKEIEKGMADIGAGRVYSADAIEADMKRDFGIEI